MKKAKRFTAILLAAVLLGGCGQEWVLEAKKRKDLIHIFTLNKKRKG